MRVDAKSLLTRLGKSDLAYREFADRFSELELWPMFEALLHDPRIQGGGGAALSIEQIEPAPAPHVHVSSTTAVPRAVHQPSGASLSAADRESLATLFARYGAGDAAPDGPAQKHADGDVRAILKLLADLGAEGKL